MSKSPDEEPIEQDYLGHTSAIGELCRQWALLDRMLSLLIETMAGVEEKTLACLTSTSRDTSQRCEIATRLAILKAPDCPWRDCLLDTLSVIQNKMCEFRNRNVHDEWHFEKSEILRISRAVKTLKNSKKVRELIYETATPIKTDEIESFIHDIGVVMIGLAVMAPRFKGGKSVMKLLAPPQPLLLLYKRYFPEPTQKTCPKPKHQPKSSRKK